MHDATMRHFACLMKRCRETTHAGGKTKKGRMSSKKADWMRMSPALHKLYILGVEEAMWEERSLEKEMFKDTNWT